MDFRWARAGVVLLRGCVAVFLGIGGLQALRADDTWTYAVQLSATTQSGPPQITVHWPVDRYGPTGYAVYRKYPGDTDWGAGILLPGSATDFTDATVSVGVNYEYQVFKQGVGYTGYGYICAGMDSPMIESRGTIILIVAADTFALSSELTRLQEDLTGDGWLVVRHDIASGADPASVKALIVNDYWSDPAHVQAVFLLGAVPIVMSGNVEYDGHGPRPLPADAFYGDIDGDWLLQFDPSLRPTYIPSDIELMVGRVDFSNMPGVGATMAWPSETELLRRYLNKDHAWRHKQVTVSTQALMANRVGDASGMAYAASGYRNFEPLVGPGNTVEANVQDVAPPGDRWISKVSAQTWLWTFVCGGGTMTSVSHAGLHGDYQEALSTDLVGYPATAVFSMLFGSHFGDWNGQDNLIRAMIAAPGVSLTSCMVGLPHWFVHHMAKGEPIGYSTRLTMNNSTLYRNQSNAWARAVTVNLMGDPTLRLQAVPPPLNLAATVVAGSPQLSWTPSAEPVLGYHVYRADAPSGPFARLTPAPVTGVTFTDPGPLPPGTRTYMVRALALQSNPSGTYYNLSQGAFVTVASDGTSSPAIILTIDPTASGPRLVWNTQPGKSYHLEAVSPLTATGWDNITGTLPASGPELSFTDTNWLLFPFRFYRALAE